MNKGTATQKKKFYQNCQMAMLVCAHCKTKRTVRWVEVIIFVVTVQKLFSLKITRKGIITRDKQLTCKKFRIINFKSLFKARISQVNCKYGISLYMTSP